MALLFPVKLSNLLTRHLSVAIGSISVDISEGAGVGY